MISPNEKQYHEKKRMKSNIQKCKRLFSSHAVKRSLPKTLEGVLEFLKWVGLRSAMHNP